MMKSEENPIGFSSLYLKEYYPTLYTPPRELLLR